MAKHLINGRIVEVSSGKHLINGQVVELVSAAPPAVTAIPPRLHVIDSQFATITASRLGGVLE